MIRKILIFGAFLVMLIGVNEATIVSAQDADEKLAGKADFIFVIDTTSSMGDKIEKVKNNITSFSNLMLTQNVEVNFALISYRDITCDGTESTIIHTFNGDVWTPKSSDIASCLASLVVHGGGDGPETPTDAFAKMFDNFNFRDDASYFAFLLTDAEAKGNGRTQNTIDTTVYDEKITPMTSVIDNLSRFSIHTSVVSNTSYEEHYRQVFEQTGGFFLDIESNFVDSMLALADWVIDTTKTESSLKLDVLERGGIVDGLSVLGDYDEKLFKAPGIICGIDSNNAYVDSDGNNVTEVSLSKVPLTRYVKKGFTADGNTRLVLRVQSSKAGTVTFTIPDDLGATLETLQRSTKSNTTVSVTTTPIEGEYPYQASAVLIAPTNYPYPSEWPKSNFNLAVHFVPNEDSSSSINISRNLTIQAVPVVLLHGFTADANVDSSFGNKHTEVGIRGMLNKAGMNDLVFPCNYDGSKGPRTIIPDDTLRTDVFIQVAEAMISVAMSGIACTRVDLIGYSMGGLVARRFIQDDKSNLTTSLSYGQGMVHRLITVATPNAGTPWASYLMNPIFDPMRNVLDESVLLPQDIEWLNFLRNIRGVAHLLFEKNGDALSDMMLKSEFVQSLIQSPVPIYSFYGEISLGGFLAKTIDENLELPVFLSVIVRLLPTLLGDFDGMRSIERIIFRNDGHDVAVNKNSAIAASNAITGYSGLNYNHMNICMMDDVGNDIVALLKAKEASFDVSGVGISSISTGTTPIRTSVDYEEEGYDSYESADIIDPNTYFIENIALSADSVTLDGPGDVVLTATASDSLSNNVYLMASIGEHDTLHRMISDDAKRTFTTTLHLTDTGVIDVSCFAQGDENNVYVSNTLQVVVKPKLTEIELSEATLSFSNAPDIIYTEAIVKDGKVTYVKKTRPGVIHTHVSSDVAIGLYITTSYGEMYDISAPSMGTKWTTDSIATVTDNGRMRGLKEGITTITASYGSLTKSISVDVGPEYVLANQEQDEPDEPEKPEELDDDDKEPTILLNSNGGCDVGFSSMVCLCFGLLILIVKKD